MSLHPDLYKQINNYLSDNFLPDQVSSRSLALKVSLSEKEESGGVYDRWAGDEFPAESPSSKAPEREKAKKSSTRSLDDALSELEESFSRMLFRMIREKDLTEVEVYKKAGMDRKLFSKIRCRDDYAPKKSTVLALSLAMELSLDETLDLLSRAGYTLSRSSRSDLIVEYMIDEGIYSLFEVNEALYAFEQPPIM